MPHIAINMLEGRTEEQKERAAVAVKQALMSAVGADGSHISVTVEDYTAEEWQEVFKTEITDKPDKVYIKPGYDPKSLLWEDTKYEQIQRHKNRSKLNGGICG